MYQRIRVPKSCDTLIYSSLTVPKGDCNIKNDCPFLQLPSHNAVLHAVRMWRKFIKPVSFSLSECISLLVHTTSTTPCQPFFFSLHLCHSACLVFFHLITFLFLNKPEFGTVEIQVLVLPTEALAIPLGYIAWPKGLLPRGQSKQTVVLLMLSHM